MEKSWQRQLRPRKRKPARKKRATPRCPTQAGRISHCEHDVAVSCKGRGSEHTPIPDYPYQARRAHITRSGVCLMTVDTASGNVTSAVIKQKQVMGLSIRSQPMRFESGGSNPEQCRRFGYRSAMNDSERSSGADLISDALPFGRRG